MSLISFSGIASGIDTKGLISAILERQRSSQIKPLTNRVAELTDTKDALSNLKTLLNDLKTNVNQFRVISGGSIAKTVSSSSETVASATASKAASAGSYTLNVSQLASTATSSFADRFSTSDAIINSSINNSADVDERSVNITIGEGDNAETVSIELTNTTTAAEFVSKFNAATTKAESTLVNVGTSSNPSYAIVINSKESGTEKGSLLITTGSEIKTAGTGALDDSTLTSTTAQNAIFSISGIGSSLVRSSNQINDVISGVSISLTQIGTTTLTIQNDPADTKKSVQKFVDSYNEILKFISENDAVTQSQDGANVTSVFGPLASVSVDESVISQLRSAFSQSSKSGGLVNTLADLGITTERDGTLKFNQDTFDKAIQSESTSVGKILENLGEKLASVDGVINQFTRYSGLIDTVINGTNSDILRNQNRISDLENSLSKQESSLNGQFARLESLIGKLNQQQTALSSLLR